MKKKTIFIILITLAILGTGFYVFFQTSSKPPSIETKEIQVPTQTENSDWKTYTNTKYGYEIQYPPEWDVWVDRREEILTVDGNETSVNIGPAFRNGRRQYGGEVSVSSYEKTGFFSSVESFDDLVQALQQEDRDGSYYYARTGKEIKVGGVRGFIYEGSSSGGGIPYTAVYVVHKDYIYSFYAGYENEKRPPSKTFPKILKTFKFIEPQ